MRDHNVVKRKASKCNNPQDWATYKRLRNRKKKSNPQRHPNMLVRLFSLMATRVKPGN